MTRTLEPDILYEDAALLVLDKPAGLVVHPAPSYKGQTLVDWVREYLGPGAPSDFEAMDRLGLVHRLDKDTSGVLVVTKSSSAKTAVGRQFHDRQVKKQYVAFVQGVPPKRTGIISAPVGRSKKVPTRMAITGTGRPSETRFEVTEAMKEVALVNLYPKTGRTHQLRVHCAAIGHPIVGDKTYGASDKWLRDYGVARPLLHAETIEFAHPTTGRTVFFQAPWPTDMKKARSLFRRSFQVTVLMLMLASAAQAAKTKPDSSPAPKQSASSVSSGSTASSATSASAMRSLKREMASLREQFKTLIEEVSALQDRVSSVQANLDEMGGARRLRDLEKAISDLNGKAVGTFTISEETKSQMLDLTRKVKAQQESFEQLRDQVDRLQQELIQSRAREEKVSDTVPAERPR